MNADFHSAADDFFVNLNLQTTLELPTSRETILQFYDAVRRQFPIMTSFYRRESGEHVLEADRESGSYPWVELQPRALAAGYFNPPPGETARKFHEWILQRSIYFLGISGLDVECLDVLFGFNLDFRGNRDAIAAQALLAGSPLGVLVNESGLNAIEFEPTTILALDPQCHLQARLSLETHPSTYQVRTGSYDDEPISIFLTIRRYPDPDKMLDPIQVLARQWQVGTELLAQLVVPHVVRPIASAIATAQ